MFGKRLESKLCHFFSLIVQDIDGFLAVLGITGGNFSPKSQKLPFAVTSVDGDSYLLYYASIGLAGSSCSNKCRGEKGILDSCEPHEGKSRLRIPVKGRIQLVSSTFYSFYCYIYFVYMTVLPCSMLGNDRSIPSYTFAPYILLCII